MRPWVSSIADNLPVATRLELYSSNLDSDEKKKEKYVQFEHGYQLGFTDVNKVGYLVCLEVWVGILLSYEYSGSQLLANNMGGKMGSADW